MNRKLASPHSDPNIGSAVASGIADFVSQCWSLGFQAKVNVEVFVQGEASCFSVYVHLKEI